MESRLPDINTEFITYRNEARQSLKSKNYDSMLGAAYAINAMLPEDYRVTISTSEYNKVSSEIVMAICQYCDQRTNYDELQVFKRLLSPFEAMLSKQDYERLWKCEHCGATNELAKTNLKKQVRKKPFFLKVVPDPPERKDGITDGRSYHRKMSKWFWQFMDELAYQESKFREDYQPKGQEFEDQDFIDAGEASD